MFSVLLTTDLTMISNEVIFSSSFDMRLCKSVETLADRTDELVGPVSKSDEYRSHFLETYRKWLFHFDGIIYLFNGFFVG